MLILEGMNEKNHYCLGLCPSFGGEQNCMDF